MPDEKDKPFDGTTHLVIRYSGADQGGRPIPAGTPGWLSPDITIVTPNNTEGNEAVVGGTNHVKVTVHNFGGIDAVDCYVDAFVCDPATGFTPGTAFAVGGSYVSISGYGNSTVLLPWTPTPYDAGHRCIVARASLIIPPDSYANSALFDVLHDRHIGQRNIHVLSFGKQKTMMFAFLAVNPQPTNIKYTIIAREMRERNEIDAVARAIGGYGLMQVGQTPLPAAKIVPIKALEPNKDADEFAFAAGPRRRRWFDPNKIEPVGAPVDQLPLSLRSAEVVPLAVAIERNQNTRPGDVHVVAVQQLDEQKRLVGGITVVVVH